MHIIVGLGNPERKYNNTRHNIGFSIIDKLSEKLDIPVKKLEHRAITGSGFINGEKIILAKPVTYMNLSGESIGALADYYNADPAEDIIVIYDDVSMEIGQLRIRKKGSAGGHNGIKNTILHLGSDEFWRIKVGVGAPKGQGNMVAHVLGHFSSEEDKIISEAVEKAAEALVMMIRGEKDQAMNIYNRKKEKPDEGI